MSSNWQSYSLYEKQIQLVKEWSAYRKIDPSNFIRQVLDYYFLHNEMCDHDKVFDIGNTHWICRNCLDTGTRPLGLATPVNAEYDELLRKKNKIFDESKKAKIPFSKYFLDNYAGLQNSDT